MKTETIILLSGIIGISLYSLFKKPYEIPKPYPVPHVVRVPTTVITPPAQSYTTYSVKMESPNFPELKNQTQDSIDPITKIVKPTEKPQTITLRAYKDNLVQYETKEFPVSEIKKQLYKGVLR